MLRARNILITCIAVMFCVASGMTHGLDRGLSRRSSFVGETVPVPNNVRNLMPSSSVSRRHSTDLLSKLPIFFEPNYGQAPARVDFIGKAKGLSLLLSSSEPQLSVNPNDGPAGDAGIRFTFLGARHDVVLSGANQLSGKSNYISSSDRTKWKTAIPNFASVQYANVYSGVDLVVYENNGAFELDFIVAPRANPHAINLRIDGQRTLVVDRTGDLLIKSRDGQLRVRKPIAYQLVGGSRRRISVMYSVSGRKVRIIAEKYDHKRPLVIDPILNYSTYLGGSGSDGAGAIAVDVQGNTYLAGSTTSSDFPGSGIGTRGSGDAIVVKLNATGTERLFSTIIGGRDSDSASAIAVDGAGFIYLTGNTISEDFPTLGAIQPQCLDNINGVCNGSFVAKLDSTGSQLLYSTYLSGHGTTFSIGIAADSHGNAYVVGSTTAADFATANALQSIYAGGATFADGDAFIVKINPDGTSFVFSTYIGGYGSDRASSVAVSPTGEACITGFSSSGNFPLHNAFQSTRQAAYTTTDGGAQWDPIRTIPSSAVTALAIDPVVPTIIYAGTEANGVLLSTDAGTSWQVAASPTLVPPNVNSIAIDRSNPLRVYAAGGGGIIRSTDRGATWSPVGILFPDPLGARRLLNIAAIEVDQSGAVFANTTRPDPTGLVKSTNSGLTFVRLAQAGIGARTALALHPLNPSIILAGDSKSTDGGETWRHTLFTGDDVNTLEISPSNPSIVYLGADGGVFRSTDTGSTWLRSTPVQFFLRVRALAIDPNNPSIVYAGDEFSGIAKTTDGGATWLRRNMGLATQKIKALAFHPQNSMVYVGATLPLDAFVTRLTAAGNQLVYSTMLGGSLDEIGFGIAIDTNGSVVTTGFTSSFDFPTINALQPGLKGAFDVFIARFDSNGAPVFCTYLGGSDVDEGTGIALDGFGNAYVTGFTQSRDFPLANALQSTFGGAQDAFVSKLSADGSLLRYSTYLGGTGLDRAIGITVDPIGTAYVTGGTASADFPTTAGVIQPGRLGTTDAFVAKIASFDMCLQDDFSGRVLLIESGTGIYQFQDCSGVTLSGIGTVTKKGCLITIQANTSDRRVLVKLDTCLKTGTASIQFLPQGTTTSIVDRNIGNNTCRCSG